MAAKDQSRQPSHSIYTVRQKGDERIVNCAGYVFTHRDGEGFNIVFGDIPSGVKFFCRKVGADQTSKEWELPDLVREDISRTMARLKPGGGELAFTVKNLLKL